MKKTIPKNRLLISDEMRTVKLPIFNPVHRNWLYGKFRQELKTPLILDRYQDLGAYIGSWVRYGDTPKLHSNDENCIEIVVPTRIARSADKHFLNILKEDVQKINDHIAEKYDFDFDTFYHSGIKQGFQQKDVIEAFIISRNLIPFFNGEIETIKKREYREELKLLAQKAENMRLQAYRRTKKIDKMVNEDLNLLLAM